MANEIHHNFRTGKNLYACRFQEDGDVFLTDGSSDEVWGTGGRDANSYDVTMTEENGSGHYVASFDASSNIAKGTYYVAVYYRLGASPADGDPALAQGMLDWGVVEGSPAEVTIGDIQCLAPRQRAIILKHFDDEFGKKLRGPGASEG